MAKWPIRKPTGKSDGSVLEEVIGQCNAELGSGAVAEVSGWLCYLSGEYGRIEGEIIGRGFAICDWRYLQKSTADVCGY